MGGERRQWESSGVERIQSFQHNSPFLEFKNVKGVNERRGSKE